MFFFLCDPGACSELFEFFFLCDPGACHELFE